MSHSLGSQAVGLRLGNGGKKGTAQVVADRTRDARLVGLIKDYTRLHHRAPFITGFSASFRILLLMRFFSAMYSTISDCDETFNYWEPLHLLTHPKSPLPFQTWEYSPQFAIRSWTYLAQYVPIAGWLIRVLGREKRAAFFATRITLAFISSLCEAASVTSVSEVVTPRVAKYMLVLLLFSAGMYESSTALLPSTFTMYTTCIAMSYAFYPSRSGNTYFPTNSNLAYTPSQRTLKATLAFAVGALIGWPFAIILSLPFVFEEIFLPSGLKPSTRRYFSFITTRTTKWITTVLISSLIAIPLFIIDTLAYGKLTLIPWNIIVYNVLSTKRGAGPELYGTEPWYYYLLNLSLNFGPTVILALLSIPLVIITAFFDPKRFASIETIDKDKKEHADGNSNLHSSESVMLLSRLAPLYIWLALLTLQPHKEERFMFPAYPLLCFNAAVALCLFRGLMEKGFTKVTKSPYRASKTYLFSAVTTIFLVLTSLFGMSRILHVAQSYHAPISVLSHLEYHELPRVVANLYPTKQSQLVQERLAKGLPPVLSAEELYTSGNKREYDANGAEKEAPKVDISLLSTEYNNSPLRLCYGKEWYRFPSSYLIPEGVSVSFIKSDFDGILPKHFIREDSYARLPLLDDVLGLFWPYKHLTRSQQSTFNDMNKEEPDQYVDISTCDYLIDVDYPKRQHSILEPRYAHDMNNWSKVHCLPFLDGSNSHAPSPSTLVQRIRATIDRVLWLPGRFKGLTNSYGDFCLSRTTRENSIANVKKIWH